MAPSSDDALWQPAGAAMIAAFHEEEAMLRREFLMAAGCAVGAAAWARDPDPAQAFGGAAFAREVALLERDARGRLGVAVLDTGTGRRFGRRADERFAMCSTFKLPLAAAVLARVDAGAERLDRRIAVPADGLPPTSPFTDTRRGGHATVAELCEATTTRSDNAAANLLLPIVGGPPGFTRFARAQGDAVTRLDRIEPMMNEVGANDPRDTTSPAAMLALVRRLALGPALKPASRALLVGWTVANKTGDLRLRAGLPADWRVGDKTGASGRGEDNDVAILWPPSRPPILVASYIAGSALPFPESNAIHARLARAIAQAVLNASPA